MSKRGIPARATLASWAQASTKIGCTHEPKFILHHDHLIDEARRWVREALSDANGPAFGRIWPAFLKANRSLFHDPAYVCATCNEQDAALKGLPGSVAAIIPTSMSLSATDLNWLANEKMKMRRFGRKRAAEAVRAAFRPVASKHIAAFNVRSRTVRAAVDAHCDRARSPRPSICAGVDS